jgi:hypothetical protein
MRRRTVLIFLSFLLLSSPAWAANAFVQDSSAYNGSSGSTVACSPASNVTAGSLIAVCAMTFGFGIDAFTGVTDNLANTYTPISTVTEGTTTLMTFYARNVAGGAATVTAQCSAGSCGGLIYVHEVSGADASAPLDKSAGQSQTNPLTARPTA